MQVIPRIATKQVQPQFHLRRKLGGTRVVVLALILSLFVVHTAAARESTRQNLSPLRQDDAPQQVEQAAPGDVAVTAIPAGGNGGGVQLRTQTVDVTIREDESGVWAETEVWLRLSNPAAEGVTVPLALPGHELAAGSLPADLQITLEDNPVAFQMVESEEAPSMGAAAAEVTIAARQQASLRLTYRQALSHEAGLVTFAYPIAAAAQWAGTPESLRVTIRFEPAVSPEQILAQSLTVDRYDNQELTWHWAEVEAQENVWLAFIDSGRWSQLAAARSAAADPAAGPAEHIALSQLYQNLAALPGLPFPSGVDAYSRYFPAAVAELQAAVAPETVGDQPSPEEVSAHGMLARLYHEQASRLGRGAGDTYLELAAAEAQTALSLGSTDASLRTLAADIYVQLSAAANARGDAEGAQTYLDRLDSLHTAGSTSLEEEQRAARIAMSAQAVDRGDLETARQVLAESVEAAELQQDAGRSPYATQALIEVDTSVAQRKIKLTLLGASIADTELLLAQAAAALRSMPGISVNAGPDWLTVTCPVKSGIMLHQTQQQLATLLPREPELALLRAVLSSKDIGLEKQESLFRHHWNYTERVDLTAARETWLRMAHKLESEATRVAAQDPAELKPAERDLAHIRQALWRDDASRWRSLADTSRVDYTVTIGRGESSRHWQLSPGSTQAMIIEMPVWLASRILGGGIAAALLIVLLAVVVWRWL